ncbi:MAG: MMPL family transporter [Candidatus Acetothermia bacterium]
MAVSVALAVVFILLLVTLRRIVPALLSLLPIGLPIVFLYGFLGLSGISLNLFTATIFTITIGVGIDYAIHFTATWEKFERFGDDAEEATVHAFNYTSRPILAIGLSALLFSPWKIHLYVSLLMWVSMVASAFLTLSFLPTVLRKIK